ncbi:elongator complex protein 5 [Penaeus vannamei]|uniref:elongator complex protein 5 n=1 Tax=Penaeus vannamei TaxID=6689 RepID=UPI000F67D432|nr:elongator complex protein 5-like [Penaeus vannamei]XP_027235617.1 elongator complex protein 5-like [Penaeus vannamei]
MFKNILGKVLKCSETPIPRFLFLTDTSEVCGRGVLWSIVQSHLHNNASIIYLSTELSPEHIKSSLNIEESNGKLHFHDATVDPCGWDNDQPNVNVAQPLHNIMNSSYVKGSGGTQKVVMVIDRLEKIALYQDPLQLIRSLHILASEEHVQQLIVLSGRDVLPENILSAVCHIASAVVYVLPTTPSSCKVVLKKPSGKVLKSHEEFTLTPDLQVQVRKAQSQTTLPSASDPETDAILAAQTTFNLALTDDQRRAKNNLLLPHTRIQSTGGQIHYTPDDVDDWDDDDPDDDLDI